jgi:aspartate/methionine/tyrosine aminotransferase
MSLPSTPAVSRRVLRMHMPERAGQIGMSVREADRWLNLDGGGHGLLDTTHFDTVRFPPPAWAAGVIAETVASGELAYTPYRGHPGVLDSVAATLGGVLGVPLSPAENLALTPGTQASLFATLAALVDEGDLVLAADPDYLFNERILAFLGARVQRVPVISDDGGAPRLDLAALEQACEQHRPKLLLFTNPSNPAGIAYDAGTIDAIAALAQRWDFRVVVDSLYCRLVYDDVPFQHLIARPGMRDRCVTLLGPSKTESMSGYRVGVAVGPAPVVDAMERVLSLTALRTGGYSQQVLRHWMADDDAWLGKRAAAHEAIRDDLVARLQSIPGVTVAPPAGSSYVFPDASGTALGSNDHQLAMALKTAGVLVSPGYQFGPAGRGRFRINFSQDAARLSVAVDLIEAVLRG